MTEEHFREFTEEVIPQQLFHVDPTDLDDDSGGKLDETILVGLIANRPTCLKHKSLQWFLDTFLIKEDAEKELFRQIQSDEREGKTCPDCKGTGEVMGSSEIGSATTNQPCFGCKGTGRKKDDNGD